MLRIHQSAKAYAPEQLAILQQAFDSVWTMLYAHVPLKDETTVKELSIALSQTLVRLAADGITNLGELKRKAAEHMLLTLSL
jgi:hypothetical protein